MTKLSPLILDISTKARSSLGPYCREKCQAKCCRKGKLLLFSDDEVLTISGDKLDEYKKKELFKKTPSGNITFNHEKIGGCQHLTQDNLCGVYEKRPQVCRDFPLFISKGYVMTSPMCPACEEGELDGYIKDLEKLGLKRI